LARVAHTLRKLFQRASESSPISCRPPSRASPEEMNDESSSSFPVILWEALNFSEANPSELGSTGICWCRDGIHFLASPPVFAAYIRKPVREVEALWRGYGFHASPINEGHAEGELRGLPDKGDWRQLYHPAGLTRGGRMEDAEQLARGFNWPAVTGSDGSDTGGAGEIGPAGFGPLTRDSALAISEGWVCQSCATDADDIPRGDRRLRSRVAFLLFANAERASATQRHPGASPVFLARVLGEMWRKLTSAEKLKWKSQAQVGREEGEGLP
jgi:hypothetical protein